MKEGVIWILVVCFLMICSCENDDFFQIEFNSTEQNSSVGLAKIDVKSYLGSFCLTVKITLTEGEMELKFISSEGKPIFSLLLCSPGYVQISENYAASHGCRNPGHIRIQ